MESSQSTVGREAVRESALALRAQHPGWTQGQIADALGVGPSTVSKALHLDRAKERERHDNARRAAAKRAWENAQRATCDGCGGPMVAGSLRADGTRRIVGQFCGACRTNHRVARVLEMVELRRSEGLRTREIAERLGVPKNTVQTELNRMRALGFDVPMDDYAIKRGRSRSRASFLGPDATSLGRALAERGMNPPIWEKAA